MIKDYCWHLNSGGYVVASSKKRGKLVIMHKLIINTNNIPDHKNGIRHDNKKDNLRIATNEQNNFNRALQSNNISGITGVRWRNDRKKWDSRISFNNKIINLGLYENFNDAVKARKQAEEKYYGEWSFDNSRKK